VERARGIDAFGPDASSNYSDTHGPYHSREDLDHIAQIETRGAEAWQEILNGAVAHLQALPMLALGHRKARYWCP
jgi:hypothetical protein